MTGDYRVRLTAQALADLEAIHAFIAKESAQNASSMIEQILDAIDLLEIFPHRTVVERQQHHCDTQCEPCPSNLT
jgi:plasmid stabilization system protein ParE